MAGMPQRRARREPAPSIIPPPEFRMLSAGQKMEHILGRSLDDAYVIAHWDPNQADVHQLSAKVRLIEIMTKHGFRFAIEAVRDKGREQAIEQLAQAITDRVVSKSDEAPMEHCPTGLCKRQGACMYTPCHSAGSSRSIPTDAHGSAPHQGCRQDTSRTPRS